MLLPISDQRSPFDPYRWKNRILVINQEMKGSQNQLDGFLQKTEELDDRDLLVFVQEGDRLICKNAEIKPLSTDTQNYPGVTLIGKDGGVKLKQDEMVDLQVIFDLIDSMPMRRSEMRRKND